MALRQRSGSTLCPSCGQLVGVSDDRCLSCGRLRPGLFGFTAVLHRLGRGDMGFAALVMGVCGLLYIFGIALGGARTGTEVLAAVLQPDGNVIIRMGAAGRVPVFEWGRWWTVLSAGWLHWGPLHILLNMLSARDLIPLIAHLYGTARTVIIYVAATVSGFLVSSFAGWKLAFLPGPLHGANFSAGASAGIFGLIGAALYYGRRGGSSLLLQHAKSWAIGGLIFGFVVPYIDNWGHLGGLAGGYLASRWLDPLQPERGDHVVGALLCLAASAAAVVASVLVPLPIGR